MSEGQKFLVQLLEVWRIRRTLTHLANLGGDCGCATMLLASLPPVPRFVSQVMDRMTLAQIYGPEKAATIKLS